MQPGYGAAMTSLDGRVAIITGAGRGIGREHALFFAAEGARVVVNDHGSSNDGSASGESPSDDVVSEIRDAGGEAVSNTDDVADWAGAERLIQTAIDAFGDLDVVVNNAGILRDRTIVNMTEAEWDEKLAGVDKSKPTYMLCKAGVRSAHAGKEFASRGFKEVYNVMGGMDAWGRRR